MNDKVTVLQFHVNLLKILLFFHRFLPLVARTFIQLELFLMYKSDK